MEFQSHKSLSVEKKQVSMNRSTLFITPLSIWTLGVSLCPSVRLRLPASRCLRRPRPPQRRSPEPAGPCGAVAAVTSPRGRGRAGPRRHRQWKAAAAAASRRSPGPSAARARSRRPGLASRDGGAGRPRRGLRAGAGDRAARLRRVIGAPGPPHRARCGGGARGGRSPARGRDARAPRPPGAARLRLRARCRCWAVPPGRPGAGSARCHAPCRRAGTPRLPAPSPLLVETRR